MLVRFESDAPKPVYVDVLRVEGDEVKACSLKVGKDKALVVDVSHFDAVTWTRDEILVSLVTDSFVDSRSGEL